MNTITNDEYISIVATIESHWSEEFNCNSCLTKYEYMPKEKREKMNGTQKRLKGCVEKRHKPFVSEEVHFNKCIGNFVCEQASEYIRMYSLYEKGIMPFKGPLMEQPAKVMNVFGVIGALGSSKIEKMRSDQERKSKRGKTRR